MRTFPVKRIDLSQRVPWAKHLTDDEAARYTVTSVLGGWPPPLTGGLNMNTRRLHLARIVRLWSFAAILFCASVCHAAPAVARDRSELDLSGPGWNLWLDRDAAWKNDTLFFPVPALDTLPVNPPTGGWDALSAAKAVPVSVPGTDKYSYPSPPSIDSISGE